MIETGHIETGHYEINGEPVDILTMEDSTRLGGLAFVGLLGIMGVSAVLAQEGFNYLKKKFQEYKEQSRNG